MNVKLCKSEGCDKPHRSRGLCSVHYERARRFDPASFKRSEKPNKCIRSSCTSHVRAKGLCKLHYNNMISQKPECKQRRAQYSIKAKQKIDKANAFYYENNSEDLKESSRARKKLWYYSDVETARAESLEYYYKNKESLSAKQKERRKLLPPGYEYQRTVIRRAALAHRLPKWVTKDQFSEMKSIYQSCPKGSHVDHIVPLRGKNVSGLHLPWNLQVIKTAENLCKGNKFDFTWENESWRTNGSTK